MAVSKEDVESFNALLNSVRKSIFTFSPRPFTVQIEFHIIHIKIHYFLSVTVEDMGAVFIDNACAYLLEVVGSSHNTSYIIFANANPK